MNPQPTSRNLLFLALLIVAVAIAYAVLTQPDQRTTTQKLGDAIHELPHGIDKAADEMKDDRTPGEKLGDDIRHAGDKIKENSAPQ